MEDTRKTVDLRNAETGKPSRAVLGHSLGKMTAGIAAVTAATLGAAVASEALHDAFDKTWPVPRQADADHPQVKRLGVKFDGKVRPNDVLAYDANAGWIECGRYTTINGNRIWRRERGRVLTYRLTGVVEPFWR